MSRFGVVLIVVCALASLIAAPVGAQELGVFVNGYELVRKSDDFNVTGPGDCNHVWSNSAGLGFPVLNGEKKAYWLLVAVGLVIDEDGPETTELRLCGEIHPMLSRVNGGIGAACGASKGHQGKGKTFRHDKLVEIENLTWKFTVGTKRPVIGHVVKKRNGFPDRLGKLVGIIDSRGVALTCAEKSGSGASKTGGATNYGSDGVFAIAFDDAGAALPKWKDLPGSSKGAQDHPVFCKRDDPIRCPFYRPKT